MAISPIQPQAARPIQPQEKTAQAAAEKVAEARKTAQEAQTTEAPNNVDRVSFRQVSALETQRLIVERVLTQTETESSQSLGAPSAAAQELFASAGKAEFEARAAQTAEDTSSEATAGRIVDGISGYIFRAFQLSNPDMTEKDLQNFQTQVMTGFETGLEDAKDIFSSLSVMNDDLAASIDQTESLVREQLDAFFQDAFETLRAENDAPEAETAPEPEPEPAE